MDGHMTEDKSADLMMSSRSGQTTDVIVAIPAREVFNPTISGYLDRMAEDGLWKR